MMNFEIKMSISRFRGFNSKLKTSIDDKTTLGLIYKFCEYLKDVYVNLVIDQVNSSRYNGEWEPVEDERYLEYLGVVPKISIVSLLRESLEVKKIGNSVYLRVNPDMMYPGSELTVLKVLRALENGTTDFSARPILYRVARKVNSNLIHLWSDWLSDRDII